MRIKFLGEYGAKEAAEKYQKKGNKVAATCSREGGYILPFTGALIYPGVGDFSEYHRSAPKSLIRFKEAAGSHISIYFFEKKIKLHASTEIPDGLKFTESREACMKFFVAVPCGQLSLNNVYFWIID